jgi:hypothetical protein
MLPATEDRAAQLIASITSYLRETCPEDPDDCDRRALRQIENAEFIGSILEQYKKELRNCDITIAELRLEVDKLNKVKKLVNS